ncbi:MAG TPA: ribonuclease PH [Polyangiaceae bacterium]|nr:ribonuclease PH [Polyangiaceae bacterium]
MPSVSRTDRSSRALRPVDMQIGFHRLAEGSVLYRAGGTVVLCTASIDNSVPEFLAGKGQGWITAEYQMHPRANPKRRENRDGRERPLGGRTREIQRLIGRALRSAVDLSRLGERTLAVDCDVLEADGGTRTASITGGFVAIAAAMAKLEARGALRSPALRDQVAAISVGHVGDEVLLDLCYTEDSAARVDLNLVATHSGAVVEIQGTAEGEAIPRSELDSMVDLALVGIQDLCRLQNDALAAAGIALDQLLIPRA